MEAFPLRAPDGTVFAYACGRCRQMHHYGAQMRVNDDEDLKRAADYSAERAAECCRCKTCKRFCGVDGATIAAADVEAVGYFGPQRDMCQECWDTIGLPAALAQKAKWAAESAEQGKAREDALAKSPNREAALSLEAYMSDLSEECYCAGWLIGLEHALWEMMKIDRDHKWGMGSVTTVDLARLRTFSRTAGGWWRHDEFVPMDEWLVFHEEHGKGHKIDE